MVPRKAKTILITFFGLGLLKELRLNCMTTIKYGFPYFETNVTNFIIEL
jgi:hypothetical protein